MLPWHVCSTVVTCPTRQQARAWSSCSPRLSNANHTTPLPATARPAASLVEISSINPPLAGRPRRARAIRTLPSYRARGQNELPWTSAAAVLVASSHFSLPLRAVWQTETAANCQTKPAGAWVWVIRFRREGRTMGYTGSRKRAREQAPMPSRVPDP